EESSRYMEAAVDRMFSLEKEAGMSTIAYYTGFQEKAFSVKLDFLRFLIEQKTLGKQVVGYGAAAKGNTLLNYCGVRSDLIPFVIDANPNKQGKYLPGSHIPVVKEEMIAEFKPDYVVLFPWNLKDELMEQLKYIRNWGGKFV